MVIIKIRKFLLWDSKKASSNVWNARRKSKRIQMKQECAANVAQQKLALN